MSTNHSLRTSVLNKNHTRTGTPSQVQSSSASVRSVARSVASTKSRASSRLTTATERERKESRPDSKSVPFGGRSISPTVNRGPILLIQLWTSIHQAIVVMSALRHHRHYLLQGGLVSLKVTVLEYLRVI